MADKEQFTFEDDDDFPGTGQEPPMVPPGPALDDDDDFPETDLSAAFSDGEHAAEDFVEEEPVTKAKAGSSRTRVLLLILLLVVAGGGGAYYFMDLGGTTAVPTVPVPAQTATTSVALPPQPAQPAAQAEPAAQPVTVAVPPPPPVTADAQPPAAAAAPADAKQATPAEPAVAAKTEPAPEKPATQAAASVPAPQAQAATAAAVAAPAPVEMAKPAAAALAEKPVVAVKQVADGAFALDAGSYLLESNRDALVGKIRELGYEPLVTPVEANLDMTRLRIGTFSKDEVQDALAFARSIEPGSYSAPAGDRYVIYAGTFMKTGNVDKLTKSFLAEGVKVFPEPVQVVRTLSRIRFGSFATREDAAAAARVAGDAGLQTVVVKSR